MTPKPCRKCGGSGDARRADGACRYCGAVAVMRAVDSASAQQPGFAAVDLLLFEGIVRFGGLLDATCHAGIAPVGNDTCIGLSVTLRSFDHEKRHVEAKSLEGKRVRLILEVL